MTILDPIIKMHFSPEFINRLDDILPFLPLRKEDMEKIVLFSSSIWPNVYAIAESLSS